VFSISEECTASIFRQLNQVFVDAEVVWNKGMCQLCGKVGGNVVNHSCGRGIRIGPVTGQWEWVSRMALLRVSSGECTARQMWVVCLWTSLFRAHSQEMYRLPSVCWDLHMLWVLEWDICPWRLPPPSLSLSLKGVDWGYPRYTYGKPSFWFMLFGFRLISGASYTSQSVCIQLNQIQSLWRQRQYVPLKHRNSPLPHGIQTQKKTISWSPWKLENLYQIFIFYHKVV
jgi:hypothetical protein